VADVGHGRIVVFYLTHPSRLLDLIMESGKHIFVMRPRFGNFAQRDGVPPFTQATRFTTWDTIRNALPKSIWFLLTLWMVTGVVAVDMYRTLAGETWQYLAGLASVCLGMAMLQFFAAILGDGRLDLARHLAVFNMLMDICLVTNGLWIGSRLVQFLRRRPFTYHPTPGLSG
jgi:hypothetical protein